MIGIYCHFASVSRPTIHGLLIIWLTVLCLSQTLGSDKHMNVHNVWLPVTLIDSKMNYHLLQWYQEDMFIMCEIFTSSPRANVCGQYMENCFELWICCIDALNVSCSPKKKKQKTICKYKMDIDNQKHQSLDSHMFG